MIRPLHSSLLGLACLLATACGDAGTGPSDGPPGDPPPLLTALPRALTPAETGIARAVNTFAFDLLRQAHAEDPTETIFLSPLSASMALGMTMNGAANGTFDAMRATLGFGDLTQEQINTGYQSLIRLLTELDPTSTMAIANSIWAEEGAPFLPAFMQAGRTWFDAEVRNVSFQNPATLIAVNTWVKEKTRGRIPKLLDQFDQDVVMTLLNAIFFKGAWRDRFNPSETRTSVFQAVSGNQSVPFMHRNGALGYSQSATFQAVDLLYGNGAFAMTVVVPREGRTLADLVTSLGPAEWEQLTTGFTQTWRELALPRFKLEYKRMLSADLIAMGMAPAFSALEADFSRMVAPPGRVMISSVLQKTMVEVNEEGTVAAAATAVQIVPVSMPSPIQVDRPFLLAIRERFSGTILFLGQVTKIPAA